MTVRSFRPLIVSLLTVVTLLPALYAATDPAVVTAAREGDNAAVRALIAKRANVNEAARDGSTALLWAVYHSDVELTRALIAAGANVNAANKYGVTPLILASRTGETPVNDPLL